MAIDLSASMNYTYRQSLTKLDYCICLAAALSYLMIAQQDPVGLVTFDTKLGLAFHLASGQLPTILSHLTRLKVAGKTDLAGSVMQLAAMLRHRSLVMLFSDLLTEEEPMLSLVAQLRHAGHDVIIFHVLDEASNAFPFRDDATRDPETGASESVRASRRRPNIIRRLKPFVNDSNANSTKVVSTLSYRLIPARSPT
ncbi:MAG: VWA domain-containing protein [Pirellulaceae bacterium]